MSLINSIIHVTSILFTILLGFFSTAMFGYKILNEDVVSYVTVTYAILAAVGMYLTRTFIGFYFLDKQKVT